MNFSRFLMVAGIAAGAVFLPACGDPTAPISVEVKVTLDGTAVEGATVTLIPKDANSTGGRLEGGFTDAKGIGKVSGPKGQYKVTIKKNEMMSATAIDPKGDNKAMIDMMKKGGNMGKGGKGPMGPGAGGPPKNAEPKNLLPTKYGSADTSGLTINIPAEKSPVEFNLTK